MSKERIKKYVIIFLKVSIAILIIFYLFKSNWLSKETFLKLFTPDHIPLLLLACVFFLAAQILCTSRFVLLLKTINLNLRFLKGFKLVMIGNFFNTIIPGLVGGDLVKGFYLLKIEEHGKGKSAGVIIMDRFLGLLAIVCIGGVSLISILWANRYNVYPYRYEVYLVLTIMTSIVCLCGVLFFFGANQQIRRRLREFLSGIFRKSIFYYFLDGFGTLIRNRDILFYSFLISILIQLFSLSGLLITSSIVLHALPNVISFAAISSVVILLGVIPITPGNIGWTELVAAIGWSVIGSKGGAEIFFYWRVITVLCSLPGGILYLVQGSK